MNKIITLILFVLFLAEIGKTQVEIEDPDWDNIKVTHMENEKVTLDKNNLVQLRGIRLSIEQKNNQKNVVKNDFNDALKNFSLNSKNTYLYYSTPKTMGSAIYEGLLVFEIKGSEYDQFLYYKTRGSSESTGHDITQLSELKGNNNEKIEKEFELICLEYKYSYFSDTIIQAKMKSLDLSKYELLSNTYLYKEIEGIQAFLNEDYRIAYEMFYQSHKMGNKLKGFEKIFNEAGEKIKEICRTEFENKFKLCKDNYDKDEYEKFMTNYEEIKKEMVYMQTMGIDCYSQDMKFSDTLMFMYAYSLNKIHSDGSKKEDIIKILETFNKEYSYYYKSLMLIGSIYYNDGEYEKAKSHFYKVLSECGDNNVKSEAEKFIGAIKKKTSK